MRQIMTTKNKVGRPLKITDSVLQKLEGAFAVGCTDLEACCYANVGASTLYDYCKSNPDFSERKETLKNQPVMKARFIINNSLKEDDLNTANRVIDRKEGQKIKQENINVELSHEEWLESLK